ncbi:MAG: radical SAM protein [Lachnospira sp.]
MKIVIFGAGKAGQHLYDEIESRSKEIEVLAFVDNKFNGEYRGISIDKPEKIFKQYKGVIEAVFIAAGAQKTVDLFIETVRSYGVGDIYMLHDIAGKNKIPLFNDNGDLIPYLVRKVRFSKEKPTLPYFEVPITDKCNLNCKGCLFACNGMKQFEDVPYEHLRKDAVRMSELFYDIPWIRILGGEPLLHPDIIDILKIYRSIYVDSEIDLCTNGLLIPKMNEEFFECLRENRITVHVSGYKPTYNMLDRIDERLKQSGVQYTVLKREEFAKYYTLEPDNDADESFRGCIASGCRELYRGKLMRCSAVIAFDKLNVKYGTDYRTVESEDWFDIHKENIDAWKLKKTLDKSSGICRYCDVKHIEFFDWDYASVGEGLKDYLLQ